MARETMADAAGPARGRLFRAFAALEREAELKLQPPVVGVASRKSAYAA